MLSSQRRHALASRMSTGPVSDRVLTMDALVVVIGKYAWVGEVPSGSPLGYCIEMFVFPS